MKNDNDLLDFSELKTSLQNITPITKANLRSFYFQHHPELTQQTFRRLLYALEKQRVIIPIGAGMYIFQLSPSSVERVKFALVPSSEIVEIAAIVQKSFPYLDYLIWDTSLLHEFMNHQPGQGQVILEVEKEACETVFNHLIEQFPGKVFLNPDRTSFERYVLNTPESIIVSRLITQSPRKISNGVSMPKLEKILVDIFADDDLFFVFHGHELSLIYENVFSEYWVNEKTLFRYAGRRKTADKLRTFINTQTQVKLLQSPLREGLV